MRVLIVDDHQVVRRGVRALLEAENELQVCGEAIDGHDAIAKAQQLKPDAIVMDISMPNMNGLDATREIRRLLPQIRIVVLSQHGAPQMMCQALFAGAHGYVVKSAISTDLITVLHRIWDGELSVLPIVLGSGGANVDVQELLQRTTTFETALRQSEQRLRSLAEYQSDVMNNMAEGLYALDAEGLVSSINPAGEGILGWTRDELVGKKMHELTHHTNQELRRLDLYVRQAAGFIERCITDENSRENEQRFRSLSQMLDEEVRARTKELEDKNADLLRQSEQVRDLSHSLLRTQDEERRHVARELHDSAGQTLAVLGMNIGQLVREVERSAPGLAKRGKEIEDLVQQINREIRTTSYLLHPPMLDESGLSSALNWYVQGLGERSGIAITVEIDQAVGRLPRDMELAIFRLVQECLTNIHRHSGSATAHIRVLLEGHRIRVEVTDQGKGILAERLTEIQNGASGVGIRGMRERLRRFGATLNIESTSSGTRVSTSIPRPQEVATAAPKHHQAAR